MMGRTHALSGLVAGVAIGQFGWHLDLAHLAVGAAVTAGAAVLPDIDHPDASVAESFGFVTEGFAWLIGHISSYTAFIVYGLGGLVVPLGLLFLWLRLRMRRPDSDAGVSQAAGGARG